MPNQTQANRKLLRVAEAARLASISRSHAYALINKGEWPSVSLGRSRRVPAEWLDRWVNERLAECERTRDLEVPAHGRIPPEAW